MMTTQGVTFGLELFSEQKVPGLCSFCLHSIQKSDRQILLADYFLQNISWRFANSTVQNKTNKNIFFETVLQLHLDGTSEQNIKWHCYYLANDLFFLFSFSSALGFRISGRLCSFFQFLCISLWGSHILFTIHLCFHGHGTWVSASLFPLSHGF